MIVETSGLAAVIEQATATLEEKATTVDFNTDNRVIAQLMEDTTQHVDYYFILHAFSVEKFH
jgi:hypothetical protein